MAPRKKPMLRTIRKVWAKGLASLPNMEGKRPRKEEVVATIPVGENLGFDLNDDEVSELSRVIQDDALARRIRKLQKEKYPYGTVPEILMADYLERRGERYKYQAQLYGGWRAGGLVPDFVVSRNGGWRALLINGNYWHNLPGKKEKDASDKLRLLNSYYEGAVITDSIIVWESQLMQPNPAREQVLDDALVGIERGP